MTRFCTHVSFLSTCDHMHTPLVYKIVPSRVCIRTFFSPISIRYQIPFAPTDVSVAVVSGSRVEVFFCDPLISSGDIWGFLVQWDTEEDFSQAIAGGDTGEKSFVSRLGSVWCSSKYDLILARGLNPLRRVV